MTREENLTRQSAEIRKFFRITLPNKAVVSQYLKDANKELEEYEAEINRLQTAIYAVESKRDRLKRTAGLYRSLLSPIHAIPSEILNLIFAFFCEENELNRSPLPAALRLTMVCGRWRDIVASTPSLWSSIFIDFNGLLPEDLYVLNLLTERFLKQSQPAPLRLKLHLSEEDILAQALPSLNALVQNSHRWETLDLSIARHVFPFTLFDRICGRIPALRSLHLHEPGDGGTDDWNGYPPLNCFNSCPSLQYLNINPSLFPPTKLPFPWDQIKTLRLELAYSESALPILSLCHGVEHLDVSEVGGGDIEPYSDHIISDSIKSISITKATTQLDVDDIFKYTTLKHVLSLEIRGSHQPTGEWLRWDETMLHDFLLRSSCSITELTLHSLPIIDTQTLSLLHMMPSLRYLCLGEIPHPTNRRNRIITRRFLDGLAVNASLSSPSSIPFLPHLTKLKFILHAAGISSRSLLQMLSSRWIPDPKHAAELGVECLRSASIVVLTTADTKPLERLQCFGHAGMNLTIIYGSASDLYPMTDESGPSDSEAKDGENE
ncbi:hypothetical protein E1B28_006557 [Marasmius oreades]|uniref:F-box domain-containing protein n=1 Tax=Marasmius oreades TaxID=181124 RepID=A0A9P7S633_9AGAR|nr:uncharacterized protein E1B28_006557 [Marasmius oreades]KAG7095865.1 hypothetical protein E1B28_006557 [Marasmius oreades]